MALNIVPSRRIQRNQLKWEDRAKCPVVLPYSPIFELALSPPARISASAESKRRRVWEFYVCGYPLSTGNAIHSGDVLVSVDQKRLDDLDPLGAAHFMNAIVSARSAIVYRDSYTWRNQRQR